TTVLLLHLHYVYYIPYFYSFFFLLRPPPPRSTLFPYTTLFRSKGAAAATLYGTEASAGVIQVFTKTGSRGSPRWDFMSEQGIVADPKNRYEDNWGFARYANLGDCVARLPDTTSTQSDCRRQPPLADPPSQL